MFYLALAVDAATFNGTCGLLEKVPWLWMEVLSVVLVVKLVSYKVWFTTMSD